jgi:hypothetical protein
MAMLRIGRLIDAIAAFWVFHIVVKPMVQFVPLTLAKVSVGFRKDKAAMGTLVVIDGPNIAHVLVKGTFSVCLRKI